MVDVPVKFEVPTKPCPMCGLTLVLESPEFSDCELRDFVCQRPAYFSEAKRTFSHYREDRTTGIIYMYAPPYRVINTQNESRISIISRDELGQKPYFKGIVTCPTIPPINEEKLVNRIKTILVFL